MTVLGLFLAAGGWRSCAHTRVGYLRTGPFWFRSGLAFINQPPSGLIDVAAAGMQTAESPPAMSSVTVKVTMPSLMFLMPRIFPRRSTAWGDGVWVGSNSGDESRLSWCNGCLLMMAMWAPIWMHSWSIRWYMVQEREPEVASGFQSRCLSPTKRM